MSVTERHSVPVTVCPLTTANAEQTATIENMISGESFTLATLNVDGMPKQILFFDVNTEGPGEENSPAIARYISAGRMSKMREWMLKMRELMLKMREWSSKICNFCGKINKK